MPAMVVRHLTASPSDVVPYDIRDFTGADAMSPVDLAKWHESEAHSDALYSSPTLTQQPLDAFYSLHQHVSTQPQLRYPNFIEAPLEFATTEPPQVYDADSPYMPQDNGRATPQSQASYSASIRAGRNGSGRSTTKSSSPGLASHVSTRVSKPRPKKAKTSKAVVGKYKSLEAPLSDWGRENGVEPKDVETLINRPIAQRKNEALSRKDGKAGRPMNQFMLYRSAYTPVSQKYCEEDGRNHQLVSKISGESWRIEPPQVREYFGRLAKRERDRHMEAFPDYKFAPKNKERGDEDDEVLAMDDPDGAYYPGSRRFEHVGGRRGGYQPDQYGLSVGLPPGLHDGHFDYDGGMQLAITGGYDMGPLQPFAAGPPPPPPGAHDFFGAYYSNGQLGGMALGRGSADVTPFGSAGTSVSSGYELSGPHGMEPPTAWLAGSQFMSDMSDLGHGGLQHVSPQLMHGDMHGYGGGGGGGGGFGEGGPVFGEEEGQAELRLLAGGEGH